MKKAAVFFTALALAAANVSCMEKTGKVPSKPEPASNTEATEVRTDTATGSGDAAASSTTVTTAAPVTTQPDPLGGGAFKYNEDGAVVFSVQSSEINDSTMISAAQALFESACQTTWNFTVGCPFEVDHSDSIQGDHMWTYYRITDSSVKSISDVEKAYYKVFSDRYPHPLSEIFTEQDGAVYALCGNRGSDIYYSSSKISGIKSKTDDEIIFTVDNYYSDGDYGEGPHTETDEFSAVIGSDNVWRAGIFHMPY